MAIDVKRDAGELTVCVSGRIDSSSSGELAEVLDREVEAGVESLTIDMSAVDFISSKGLRVLVSTYKKLEGGELAIEGANEAILEVMRLSGLLKIFTIR